MSRPTAPKNLRRDPKNPYLLRWDDHAQGNMWEYFVQKRSPNKGGDIQSFVGTVTVSADKREFDCRRIMHGDPWCVIRLSAESPNGRFAAPDIFVGKGFPEGKSLDVSKLINKYTDLRTKYLGHLNTHVRAWANAQNQRRGAAAEAHMRARVETKRLFILCSKVIRELDNSGQIKKTTMNVFKATEKSALAAITAANATDGKFPKPRKSERVVDGTGWYINADGWPGHDRTEPQMTVKNDGRIFITHPTIGTVYAKGFTWAMDGGSFAKGTTLTGEIANLSGKLNIQINKSPFSCTFTLPKGQKKPKVAKPIPHHHNEEHLEEVKEKLIEVEKVIDELKEML